MLLNQEPPAKWLKTHPFAANVKYLPVEKVEFLLTKIFQTWEVEVVSYAQVFNSISVQVRLKVVNPITGEWMHQDGLGAVGIQTDAGSAASDLVKIKHDAVMKALPAAKSYAIKDAAEHFGKIFGRDLNRKDVIGFTPAFDDKTREMYNPDKPQAERA